jgi:iron complex outermembrane receptor protein
MKLSLLLSAVLLINTALVAQQKGAIKGIVKTSDGQPAPYVNVALKNTNKGVSTNPEGSFEMKHVEAGSYTLVISFIGLETKEQTVEVTAGQTLTVPEIILKESAEELSEIVVTGYKTNPFDKKQSEYVSKMPLSNMENPQVYSSISKELLADQFIFSADDAMRNATGVTKMWDATGRSGDGGGYYNIRGFIVQSQLRNGLAGNVSSYIDAANLERIEVIKGPSATLFGSSLTSYGGLVNRVTKRPHDRAAAELTFSAGSFGFSRVSADVNTPLDKDENVLFRVNTAYHSKGSFQDNGFNKNFAFAPSLSYKINDRLSFLAEAEIYAGQNTGLRVFFFPWGQTIESLGATRADQLNIDYKRSYVNEDLYQTSRNVNLFGQMDYEISDRWRSQTNVTVTNSYSDGPSPYFYLLSNAAVTGNADDVGNGFISRNDQYTDNSTNNIIEIQQNFIGDFKLGNFRNRFVGGLDFFHQDSDQFFSGGTYDTIYALGDENGLIPGYRDFNRSNMDKIYMNGGANFTYPMDFVTNTYSAYVSDVLNLTDYLTILAAVRLDHFDSDGSFNKATGRIIEGTAYTQTALSPKFGIVYQVVKDKVSVFGNYQNGFTNKAGTDYKGNAFKPEQANQVEGGVKVDVLGGRLSSTLSYYSIKVTDIIRQYPSDMVAQIQDGTQESKGFEAEVIANPIQGLNVVAGFAYNESQYKKTDIFTTGLRPGTASSPYAANFWISYRLPENILRGVGVGFGGNYASDNKIINSRDIGVFTLPAYTVLNATAFYDHPKFRFGIKVDNLTNKKYWIGYTTVNPQELRSITGSLSLKF